MPIVGDIIFFDWNEGGQDGVSDHVGIVEYYDIETNIVHTIEGNSSDECKQREYSKDDNQIMGYGRPKYQLQNIANYSINRIEVRENEIKKI